jgi:hypothetical protein
VPRKVQQIHQQTEIWIQIPTLALLLLSLLGAAYRVTLVSGVLRNAKKSGRNCKYGLWSLHQDGFTGRFNSNLVCNLERVQQIKHALGHY